MNESETTISDYAQALLEESAWNLPEALEALTDRSIEAVSSGHSIKNAWRRSLTVAIEMNRLVTDHEVNEQKKRWAAELRTRYAELMRRS